MIIPDENTKWLLELLSLCDVSPEEFEHRKKALENAQYLPESVISRFNDLYYNLAHEIKSFHFLQQFGKIIISEDHRHKAGCDCNLNNYYQIECVCSSAGKNTKGVDLFGKRRESKVHVGNYDKSFLLSRLTQSLDKKLKFFNEHIKSKTINPNCPYIVFLGLGALSYEIFTGKNGVEFTSILFGRGDPALSVNIETGRMTPVGYTHNDMLFKHNGSEINCNIFSTEDYRCVSGIIISSAKLDEEYTADNTWLFINPNAYIKINAEDFSNIVYWDLYSDDEYGPYKNGLKFKN